MKKQDNAAWRFFASVKLALFTLIILAITSIIGTIIPQGKPPAFYVQEFGVNTARLFQYLDVPDMYGSWWFLSLLGLFSMNLIVCTLDRLPRVWKMVVLDNLATDPARLEKMGHREVFHRATPLETTAESVRETLAAAGWKPQRAEKDGGILFFAQKRPWSRLGVYVVHTSILIIFVGAIIGSLYGYKASIMLPEGATADRVFKYDANHTEVLMPFQLRCDGFSVSFYNNGAPREFKSDLVVIKDGKEVLAKSIEVNDPLQYGGLTFYQSSYQAYDNEFMVTIANNAANSLQKFIIPAQQQVSWAREGVTFGIINMSRSTRIGKKRYKIWFSDGKATPAEFWVEDGGSANIERPGATYNFTIKQRYATGLQVARDPGVWTVYLGCTLMLLGLYAAFFLSHQRIWVYITPEENRSRILLSGTVNKNKLAFERAFEALARALGQKGDQLNS